jgi:predicted nucleic acid-binding protein
MEKPPLKRLTYIKAKATASNLQELSLSSEDLILCEEIMAQHATLTFFDALHASLALSNKLEIVSNDEAYEEAEVKRIPFKEFPKNNRKAIKFIHTSLKVQKNLNN